MATTWNELADEVKSDILKLAQTGQLNLQSVTDLDGISQTFLSPSELIQAYRDMLSLAQAEEDANSKPEYRPIAMRRGGFRR